MLSRAMLSRRSCLWALIITVSLVVSGLPAGPVVAGAQGPDQPTAQDLVGVARQLIERRTSALVDTQDAASLANPFIPTFGRASASVVEVERLATAELLSRRDLLRQVGEAYTGAKSAITMKSIDRGANSILLSITERTTLTYAKIVGDEPDFTAFVTERQFTFARDALGWVLMSQGLSSTEGPAPINEPTGASRSEMQAAARDVLAASRPTDKARTDPHRASANVTAAASYDYVAMAAYAERYWSIYNSAYRTFNERGGDCTNFVSQALRAGGWADSYGWYRDDNNWWYNSFNQTWTWINVDYWYAFAALRSRRTYILSQPELMGTADVLQADFTNDSSKDHTMIVSYRSPSQPYLTYHTNDTFRRSLSSLKLAYPNARWIAHRT